MRRLLTAIPCVLLPVAAAGQGTMQTGRVGGTLRAPPVTPPAARPATPARPVPRFRRTGPIEAQTRRLPRRMVVSPTPPRPRSRVGFIQLPASGPGYYAYQGGSRRWGTPALVYGIERAARRWEIERRTLAERSTRIGIGDLSRENGGRFAPHVSHRTGKDVDVRPQRRDGREGPTTIRLRSYSRDHTQRVIGHFRAELNVRLLLFNDRSIRGTRPWPNHSNHFHLRI